jgi:hypothetical protein
MAEELYSALQQFHRDIVVPDMQRMLLQFHREVVIPDMQRMLLHFHRVVAVPEIVGTLREEIASFKRETHANFDTVWKHFEVLDSEYHALSAAVRRIEEKLGS